MEYEFKNIESLIRSAIDSAGKSNKAFAEPFVQIKNAVAAECKRIKKSFTFCVWQLENSQQRSHYVQYHQHRLILLIDELFEISRSEKAKGASNHSRLSSETFFLYDQLEDILTTIRKSFSEYYSLDIKVPEPDKEKVLKSIENKCSEVRNYNRINENDLITICLKDVSEFQGQEGITYRKIEYTELLIDSITDLVRSNQDNGLDEKEIQSLLFSLNYNCQEYFKYYVDNIQDQLAELGSDSERLEKLAFHNKTINQVQPKSGLVYDSDCKGIKTQLSEWISEEVQFLERRRDLTTVSHIAENDLVKKDFKLEFDMSVSQFAFFIKSFIETGVIQNKNISELIRFLSKFVKTKRSENISYESFRIKYYNVEDSTKNAVKNTLHNSIGYINSN